jgi:hypothetical protein
MKPQRMQSSDVIEFPLGQGVGRGRTVCDAEQLAMSAESQIHLAGMSETRSRKKFWGVP